jgi:uncharacterized BrkB/YihY/UPF0761 family membrane protein
MTQKSIKLSAISLIIACLALILATIPTYVIESKIAKLENERIESKEPITLEVKGVTLSFGNKKKLTKAVDNPQKIEKLNNYLLISKVAMIIFVAIAIFSALFALVKEKNKPLNIGSIITACVAILWQYVAAGISTGVAIFILIMLLLNFGT